MVNNRKKVTLILMFFMFFSVLGTAFSADNPSASITASFNPSEVKIGDNVTLVVTITNNGPFDFTKVLVKAKLPQGLTYLSHYTGLDKNNYDPNTGIWDVGNMNFGKKGATKTLNITATVTSQVSNPVTSDVQFNQAYYNNNGQETKLNTLPSSSATLKVQNSNSASNSTSSSNPSDNTWIYLVLAGIIIVAIILVLYFKKIKG